MVKYRKNDTFRLLLVEVDNSLIDITSSIKKEIETYINTYNDIDIVEISLHSRGETKDKYLVGVAIIQLID